LAGCPLSNLSYYQARWAEDHEDQVLIMSVFSRI
jgi:hypothetical protein